MDRLLWEAGRRGTMKMTRSVDVRWETRAARALRAMVGVCLFVWLGGRAIEAGSLTVTGFSAVDNPQPGYKDYFGQAVAPLGGDRFVVGAPRYQSVPTNAGTAHLFDQSGSLLVTFTNPAPEDNDHFGGAVACVGLDRVAVAAHMDDAGAQDAGTVYLFDTNGLLLVTLTNPAPVASDYFGATLTGIGDQRLAVGAYNNDAGAINAGCVYVFDLNGGLVCTLTNPVPRAHARFGAALAPAGTNKLLVGAPYDSPDGVFGIGSAWLYDLDGTLLLTLTNPTPESSDYFGCSLADIGDEFVAVGAQGDNTGATNTGCVYLFNYAGELVTTLTNPAANAYDYFGRSVACIGGAHLLAGASSADPHNTGAAWIFSATGDLLAGMTNPAAGWDESFGYAVASLGATQYLVSVPYAPSGGYGDNHKAGRVYIYEFERGARYYVNDDSTVGDVWCAAAGNDAHSGTTPGAPKASVQAIIDAYTLEAHDVVYVDTGYYPLTNNITITADDGGAPDGYVTIQGSGAGTVLDRGVTTVSNHYAIDLNNVTYVRLRQLTITNGFYGMYLTNADYCAVEDVIIRDTLDVGLHLCDADVNTIDRADITQCKDGIYMFQSSFNTVENSLVWSNRGNGIYLRNYCASTRVVNCTVAWNGYRQIDLAGKLTSLELLNSIVVAEGEGNYCISRTPEYPSPAKYRGQFNNLWARDGASIGAWYASYNTYQYRLADWQMMTGEDTTSLSCNPLFVNPGAGNFHVQSKAGHYSESGVWTNGTKHSPCIDTGDPAASCTEETQPNGSCINMGRYGNTPYASRSDTHPYLHVIGLYDGGYLWNSTVDIRWRSFNMAPTARVRIAFSPDAGSTWSEIASSVAVTSGLYRWTADIEFNRQTLVRVAMEDQPSVMDVNDEPFVLTQHPRTYYVNDDSLQGDIYCTAPGDDANDGLSPDQPKATLSSVRDQMPCGGDIIKIDTGCYAVTSELFHVNGVHLQGSPAGSVIRYTGSPTARVAALAFRGAFPSHRVSDLIITDAYYGISCENANGITISNITLHGIRKDGIQAWDSSNLSLYDITVEYATGALSGVYIDSCSNVFLDGLTVRGMAGHGLFLRFSHNGHYSTMDITGCGAGGITLGGSSSNHIMRACVYGNAGPGIEFVHAQEEFSRYLNEGVYYRNSDANSIEHCTVVDNQTMAQIYENAESGTAGVRYNHSGYGPYYIPGRHSLPAQLRNTIIAAQGTGRYCFVSSQRYVYKDLPSLEGDYNLLNTANGARIAYLKRDYEDVLIQSNLVQWQQAYGHDLASIAHNPLFVDPTQGDYHLRSGAESGTYVKAIGGWTNFPGENSPGIDLGDPRGAYVNEPAPNGGVVNLGAYGNTMFASRSVDTDKDGLSDTLERYRIETDPDDPDSDHDGASDRHEHIAGTCPTNAASVFRARRGGGPVGDGDEIVIEWPSAAGRTYSLQYATNLLHGFSVLESSLPATPPLNRYTNSIQARPVYYRISVAQ
ncbi:MAG: hypothetical protein EOM20_07555 [Spartobacteria bacterium]|nr:hypothetical protein [Spartobacteria bacterium]